MGPLVCRFFKYIDVQDFIFLVIFLTLFPLAYFKNTVECIYRMCSSTVISRVSD